MDNLALELVEFLKEKNDDLADEYQRIMYALEDMECLEKLPEKFHEQEVVEDAWDIARCREIALSPDEFIKNLLPKCLSDIIGVDAGSYFVNLVSYEIESHIDEIFNELDVESVKSDAFNKVIDELFNENAWEICKDYIEYMREEYGKDLCICYYSGIPFLISEERGIEYKARLDSEKIEEIAGTSDYSNIEFDWSVRS